MVLTEIKKVFNINITKMSPAHDFIKIKNLFSSCTVNNFGSYIIRLIFNFLNVTFDLEGLTLSPEGQEQLTAAGFFCSALVGFGVGSGSGGGSVTRDCSH